MNKVAKSKNSVGFIKSELEKAGLDLKVGDRIIDRDGNIFEIDDIYIEKHKRWADENGKKLKKAQTDDVVMISYGYWTEDEETGKKIFSRYGTNSLDTFNDREYIKLSKSYDELRQEAITSLTSEEKKEDNEDTNYETALVQTHSKENLLAIKDDLNRKREIVEIRSRMLKRILDSKRNELKKTVDEFRNKIEKIQKVIYTIELYLGIKEQVVLLQEGQRAPAEEPISFRQQVLFMDEEVGDPEDDGIDFKRIDEFDAWLLKNKNYIKVIPEKKGVVILRVRRKDKEYSDNPFINSMLNENNKETYILIRNGDRICRIWADIIIHPRLFPQRNEFQELMEIASGRIKETKEGRSIFESDKKKADDEVFRYRQQMIMMQGMIDRTELFHPLPSDFEIKLSKEETFEKGYVRFIYDDEIALPDGRLSFDQWRSELNSTIHEGSRIIISGKWGDRFVSSKEYFDRVIGWENKRERSFTLPSEGVYQVEKHVRQELLIVEKKIKKSEYDPKKEGKEYEARTTYDFEKGKNKLIVRDEYVTVTMLNDNGRAKQEVQDVESLIIKYNPGGGVYKRYDYHERKNRISFIIEPDDPFILNYDEASLDDVDFYLNSRVNRAEYLWMMPCLYSVKQMRLAEIEFEKDFVKMTVGQLLSKATKKGLSEEKIEAIVWDNVKWWKLKNKWKRGIDKDDTKALRMIKKRIEKQILA